MKRKSRLQARLRSRIEDTIDNTFLIVADEVAETLVRNAIKQNPRIGQLMGRYIEAHLERALGA